MGTTTCCGRGGANVAEQAHMWINSNALGSHATHMWCSIKGRSCLDYGAILLVYIISLLHSVTNLGDF